MEQSKDVVVLEYQTAQGPGTDPYWTGTVEGVFVTPGFKVMTPVGASGVPPHVQTVVP